MMKSHIMITGEGLTKAELQSILEMEPAKRDEILTRIAKLEAFWAIMRTEFQPLKDKLEKFGITFDDPYDLLDSPPNTYVLAIPTMVEYLDIFKNTTNQDVVLRYLDRPEARGLVGDSIIRFYRGCTTRNEKWLANRAIGTTAQAEDIPILTEFFLDTKNKFARDAFPVAFVRLLGKESIPLLVRGLRMEDEVVLASIKALRKFKSKEAIDAAEANSDSRHAKLRRASVSYLKSLKRF